MVSVQLAKSYLVLGFFQLSLFTFWKAVVRKGNLECKVIWFGKLLGTFKDSLHRKKNVHGCSYANMSNAVFLFTFLTTSKVDFYRGPYIFTFLQSTSNMEKCWKCNIDSSSVD